MTMRSCDIRLDVSSGACGIDGKDLPLSRMKDHRPSPVGSCPFDFTAWLTSSRTVARQPPYWKLLVRVDSCLLKATEDHRRSVSASRAIPTCSSCRIRLICCCFGWSAKCGTPLTFWKITLVAPWRSIRGLSPKESPSGKEERKSSREAWGASLDRTRNLDLLPARRVRAAGDRLCLISTPPRASHPAAGPNVTGGPYSG